MALATMAAAFEAVGVPFGSPGTLALCGADAPRNSVV